TDDTPEFNITDEASNSDEPNNASASDISDNTSKSDEKLRDQEASSEKLDSSRELEEFMSPPLSCDMKTVNTVHDQEKTLPKESVQNISQKSIGNSAEASTYVPSEVVQDSAPAELAHLLYQASKARKKSVKLSRKKFYIGVTILKIRSHTSQEFLMNQVTKAQIAIQQFLDVDKISGEVSRNEDTIASKSLQEVSNDRGSDYEYDFEDPFDNSEDDLRSEDANAMSSCNLIFTT
ncbi:10023_t:CDS:2, partial [Acaulospora morrowiae]